MTDVDFFKNQAKFLHKDFNKGNPNAIARYNNVFVNKDNPSLMNFQHIIAKEATFNNWNELISANEQELAVAKVLYSYPTMCNDGLCLFKDITTKNSVNEQKNKLTQGRRGLLTRSDIIVKVSDILKKYIEYTKTIRSDYNSYKIKHFIEQSLYAFGIDECYLSNGELIVAAIVAGFNFRPCSQEAYSLNAYFNMQKKSLEKLPGYK